MTSKSLEALENIAITFDEMGFVPTTLCPYERNHFIDWFKSEYSTIKQDLERLELVEMQLDNALDEMRKIKDDDRKLYLKFKELENENLELKQIWNKEEWCKGIPLSAESLKSLFNYNEELFEENLKLDKENLILKQSVKDTCDTSQEIIADLKEENEQLILEKEELEQQLAYECGCNAELVDTQNENQKLKKAIKIIKDKLRLSLNDNKANKTINAVLPIGNNDMNRLTQEEYELLKEVLMEYEN